MDSFTIVQGDTGKAIQRQLLDSTGTGIDTDAGGGSVKFLMKKASDDSTKINLASTTVINGATGIHAYIFQAADIDSPAADYLGRFVYTNGAGKVTSYPTESGLAGWIAIEVLQV